MSYFDPPGGQKQPDQGGGGFPPPGGGGGGGFPPPGGGGGGGFPPPGGGGGFPPPGGGGGFPPSGGGGGFQAAPQNNTKALVGMILGIVGILLTFGCLAGILLSVPAAILGHMAKKEIDSSHGTQGGRGMAVAGQILGYVGIALWVLFIVLVVLVFSAGWYAY